jgi:hypothetical protein
MIAEQVNSPVAIAPVFSGVPVNSEQLVPWVEALDKPAARCRPEQKRAGIGKSTMMEREV